MIRIQRVYGSTLPIDRQRIQQAQEIFRQNFGAVASYADKFPDMLDNPFKYGYATVLLVSETAMAKVTGFSLILHFPEINSSLLDFIAAHRQMRGGGIGGSLFEATEEYLQRQG
jgi:GNAT superfamily N-acetyltransferase